MNYHSSSSSWDSSKLSALSVALASVHDRIPDKVGDSLRRPYAGSDATAQAAPSVIWQNFPDGPGHALEPDDTLVGLAEASR